MSHGSAPAALEPRNRGTFAGGGALETISHSALPVRPLNQGKAKGSLDSGQTPDPVTSPRPRLPCGLSACRPPLPACAADAEVAQPRAPRDPEPQKPPAAARGESSVDLTGVRGRDPREPARHPSWSGPIKSNLVMAGLRVLLLLAPLACALTSEPAPRFWNLRLEPDELRLTWNGEVSSRSNQIACRKGVETPVLALHSECVFPSLSLCHMTNFSVFLREDPDSAASIQFPESDPDRASAATDLRCWVHNVDTMMCRWGRGPGADKHVQYRMWWRKAALGRDHNRECVHYDVTDAWGTHLGCKVDGITRLPTYVTVMVTGGGASCSDISVDLQRVEVLTPPMLTATCNGSKEAHVRWEMRSHFHHGFQYEMQINKSSQSEPETEKTFENHFQVLIPGSASFRVRAKPKESARFSNWSQTVWLDCVPGGKHTTAMAASLVALGTALMVLAMLLLCRRPLRTKLFPPIPRVKELGGGVEPVMWTAAPEDPEVTVLTED